MVILDIRMLAAFCRSGLAGVLADIGNYNIIIIVLHISVCTVYYSQLLILL